MSESIKNQKQAIRNVLLMKRSQLPVAETARLSLIICRYLSKWVLDQKVTSVFLYMPVRGEIDPRPLLKLNPALTYALPVTSGSTMQFYQWAPGDPLNPGPYGIHEPTPKGAALMPNETTAILVPSLAVSLAGVRLGYGGGYFDRYLAGHRGKVIAVTTDLFLLPELPFAPHDQLMDWVVTESGVLKLR